MRFTQASRAQTRRAGAKGARRRRGRPGEPDYRTSRRHEALRRRER